MDDNCDKLFFFYTTMNAVVLYKEYKGGEGIIQLCTRFTRLARESEQLQVAK
jgi:hypothetical protein